MAEVCDPIAVLEVPLDISVMPVRAFVANCQFVVSHDGEDPFIIMVS